MRVIGTKRTPASVPHVDKVYTQEETDEVLGASDFVVLLLPTTPETRNFINKDRLRAMKPTAWLLNFARGALIVDADLIAAVQSKTIAGAVLDVFRKEPLPETHPFWQTEGILVLPHLGGGHPERPRLVAEIFVGQRAAISRRRASHCRGGPGARILSMKTILMTGAAGRIGSFLRPELAGKYKLRLSDIKPIKNLQPGETFVRADISRLPDMLRVTKGVDAVVHFGGQSGEHDWDHILSANIIGFYNTLEAARQNGVKRFLVATSNHAVGFYRCDQTIDHTVYTKPDSRYGVSKVFNEALSSLYADRYGMEMFCMRIGNVNHVPIDRRRLGIWISGRDMAQLVTIGIERPKLHFEVVYGISDNKRAWFDNANARAPGLSAKGSKREIREGDPEAGGSSGNIAGGHLPGRWPLHVRRRDPQPAGYRAHCTQEDKAK